MAAYTLIKKPLTITEVFVRGWDMFIATFWSVVPFSLMVSLMSVPGHVAQQTSAVQKGGLTQTTAENTAVAGKGIISGAANSASGSPDAVTDATNQLSVQVSQMSTGTTLLIAAIVFIAILIALFIFCGIYAALIKQIDSSVKGKKLNFIEALFAGFSKSFTILGACIIAGIAVVIGLALLVLPGIYIGIALFFVSFLPVVENLGVMDSLKESMRLVSGHWWRTFFSLFIVGIVIALFQILVAAVLGIALAATNTDVSHVSRGYSAMVAVIMILAQTALLPLMYSFYLSILYDLQSRKDAELPVVVSDKR